MDLNPVDPHLEVDEDNIEDEDQSEDYVVFPARVIPEWLLLYYAGL